MTPALAQVYESLIGFAAGPAFRELVSTRRKEFAERVGSFDAGDSWFEERSAAFWDRILCDREFLRQALRGNLSPNAGGERMVLAPALEQMLGHLVLAQRGLFEIHAVGNDVDMICVVRGAAFRLASADGTGAGLREGARDRSGVAPGWLDGWVVPCPEGVALLPGVLIHPADAAEPIRQVVDHTTSVGMEFHAILDELLAMRHRLAARSRMKARQVYRVEGLNR